MRKKVRNVVFVLTILVMATIGVDRVSQLIWRHKVVGSFNWMQSMTPGNKCASAQGGIVKAAESRFGVAIEEPLDGKNERNTIELRYGYRYLAMLNGGPMPNRILINPKGTIRAFYWPPRLVWSTWLLENVAHRPQAYELLIHFPTGKQSFDSIVYPQLKLVKAFTHPRSLHPFPPLVRIDGKSSHDAKRKEIE